MTEVLLAMSIVALATPFIYFQIDNANNKMRDISVAKNISELRGDVLNFVRLYQDSWPETAQIKLADEELATISDGPVAGFVDKYVVNGASVTDVYLAFDLETDVLRVNRVAQNIGSDAAAVVGDDGVAYATSWAVSAPDFRPGYLIYRVSRDVGGEDMSKFLHRGATEDELNVMMRDLNMGGNDVYNFGNVNADSIRTKNASANFINADNINATNVYFSDGATLDGGNITMQNMRVTGDVSGFRSIVADKLNGNAYTTNGHIITDRATINNAVNVSRDFVLKSDTGRTISGFTAISANTVLTPFVSAEQMVFYGDFGLTVSGELMMSTTPPLKIGGWSFPSTTPPRFTDFSLARAQLPNVPDKTEFGPIMSTGWKSAQPQVIK